MLFAINQILWQNFRPNFDVTWVYLYGNLHSRDLLFVLLCNVYWVWHSNGLMLYEACGLKFYAVFNILYLSQHLGQGLRDKHFRVKWASSWKTLYVCFFTALKVQNSYWRSLGEDELYLKPQKWGVMQVFYSDAFLTGRVLFLWLSS